MGLLQFVSYLTIYINQAGCRGQSRLPWIRCIVPSKCPECGCLFCSVAEGFAVGNRRLSIWLGWGKTGRFKGQAALPLSVQSGDFVPLPTPSTPLAVLCDVHSGVRGSPSYNPQSRKEPSLRFTGCLWLMYRTCLFTKELQLPMGSRYWKQVMEYLCFMMLPAHWWLQGPQGHTLKYESFAQWAGPLDLWWIRHGCKLHHIRHFCKLSDLSLVAVCLQDILRMTEIPVGLCQLYLSGTCSLLLGPRLEIHLKSDVLRLGGTLLYLTRKFLGFLRHVIS